MRYKTQAHVLYKTRYHIVWMSKYRYKVFKKGVGKYFEGVLNNYLMDRHPDVHIIEINTQPEHVHILLEIPPKYSVSTVVRGMKSVTSKVLRKKFEYLRRGGKGLWSIGYFVSTVGLDEGTIANYIKYQEAQDKGRSEIVLGKDATAGAKRSP